MRQLRAVALLLLVHVVGAQARQQIGLIAVHVHKRLEAVLLPRVEQPVDGPLLVGLAVVAEELLQEVVADHLARAALAAERVGDVAQVLLQGLGPVGGSHPGHEVADDVVLEVLVVGDGQHVVLVGHERGVRDARQVLGQGVALVRQNEAVLVQRVAPQHAAHGIADERDDLVAAGAHVLVALERLGDLLGRVEDAGDGHVLVLHLDGHLPHHVVDLREDAVELLLVGLQLVEARIGLGLPGLVLVSNKRSH